jgi:exosortase J
MSTSTGLASKKGESPLVQKSLFSRIRIDRQGGYAGLFLWSGIGLLAVAGSLGVAPQLAKLWEIWTTDPLRSIGMLIFPASIILILRVWRQCGWELKGTWWGLLPAVLAFVPLLFSEKLVLFWAAGGVRLNFLPNVFPIYLYASGIVLLFAGVRVWRRAWFPLALLLFLQPVPESLVHFLDLPLQGLSAHIARSFAGLLGFSPTNPELLRLMFTPNFGMFIAPGCDGMRGAITLGYGALIAGYLKRVSALRWAAYVLGALLLGHVFNLMRLCGLVLYYRIAVGHPALERMAEQADYGIGALLFLLATFLFLWMFRRKGSREDTTNDLTVTVGVLRAGDPRNTFWKIAVFAVLVVAVAVPGVRATEKNSDSLALALHRGEIAQQDLDDRIPRQVGAYKLVRVWGEQIAGAPVLEAAAYQNTLSDEIEIGVWLPPTDHSIQQSLMTHGETPKAKVTMSFATGGGQPVLFNTALYDDGITNTLIGDTYCTPISCQAPKENQEGFHLALQRIFDHRTRDRRAVPIFFKMQVMRTGAPTAAVFNELAAASQDFLAHLDFTQLSRQFQ